MIPEHVDGGFTAAEVALVDDVIVDQRRRVDHLADHGHLPLRGQQSTVDNFVKLHYR